MGVWYPSTHVNPSLTHCLPRCTEEARLGSRRTEEDFVGSFKAIRLQGINSFDLFDYFLDTRIGKRLPYA